MILYLLFFSIVFLLFFTTSLICLFNKNIVKGRFYLIIPSICVGLWALLALLVKEYSTPVSWDFKVFYRSGVQILTNPANLYDVDGYLYLPAFAIFFAVTFSLLPLDIAASVFFIMSYILAILTIIEFDKVLILMNMEKKIHRFFFLMIISNGFFVLNQFKFNQSKYILFFILVFVVRREIQKDRDDLEKDFKYYLINYCLFIFAISIAPYFIFFLIIYIFYDIPINQLLIEKNLKKYFLICLIFIIQNFLFLLYPSQIFDFLDGFNHPKRRNEKLKLLYLREFVDVSSRTMVYLSISSTIFLSIITITLIYKSNLKIEEKFGYFAIAYIFFGVFAYTLLTSLLLFSFVILLFAPFLNENLKDLEFIKGNKYVIIGLLSVVGIFFTSYDSVIFKLNPIFLTYPYNVFYYARYIFLLSVMMISLILIFHNKDSVINNV